MSHLIACYFIHGRLNSSFGQWYILYKIKKKVARTTKEIFEFNVFRTL